MNQTIGKCIHPLHKALLGAVRATVRRGAVDIDAERCKGCGLCVGWCPAQTLALSAETNMRGYRHSTQVRPHDCIGCGTCATVCPDGCITCYRK